VDAPLLQVENLSVHIDSGTETVRAVDDVSFALREGETFALLGESGCGKSMTALGMMRLVPEAGRIVSGRVLFGGRDLLELSEAQMREVRGGELAMIFQEPATSLNPVLTVGTQIGEVLAQHQGLGGSPARSRAIELLAAVGIPDASRRIDEYPFQLSGGMKQRAMIASALACAPKLLIADEPTTALDVTIQAQVLELLARLQRERRMAMLLITHDLGLVAQVAQHVGVMYAGSLIETAPRERLFATAHHPYAAKLFAALPSASLRGARLETIEGSVPSLTHRFSGCRFAERCTSAWERCHREVPKWTTVAQGHSVRCHLYDPPRSAVSGELKRNPSSRPVRATGSAPAKEGLLLDVHELRVHFPVRRGVLKRVVGHVKAVDGVSLKLGCARTLALVGESGCGKTTVGKAILQLVRPTAGSVTVSGRPLQKLSAAELRKMRARMQMIFQDPYASLNPRMHVGDIIAEGMRSLGAHSEVTQRQARVGELLTQVGLAPEMAQRYPHEFSGGQRQRIAIARSLAVNPRLLICDEPTSALDVSVQAQILNLLKGLQRRLGLSYLFITHNIAVVDYLAHEVAVMYLGRIVEHGQTDEILREPKHPYTEALLSAVPEIHAGSGRRVITLKGDPPSPLNPPAGCHFHPRCARAVEVCRTHYPPDVKLGETRSVSCHLYPKPDDQP
jgi:peptide/nickel transport system ATP-binding protein